MVSVRDTQTGKLNQSIDDWLIGLGLTKDTREGVKQAYALCQRLVAEHEQGESLLLSSREMIAILATMGMDLTAYRVAMLYPLVQEGIVSREQADEFYGKKVSQLLDNVERMEAIRSLQIVSSSQPTLQQVDNLRHMLLAMVEDVRAVVIKLAERICYLHSVKNADEETRVMAARETSDIYAPLANRLGIGQLKWELEDFAFRYQHPQTYKQIAKMLDERRLDREEYIAKFLQSLEKALKQEGINAEVQGRPKHIYSIWKKMQRKELAFDELFDVRAVRVVVDRLQDCYAALGVVHTLFHHLPSEFDDYVANPKSNGYQSIHTVVLGPQGKTVEIQIRTEQMHQDSELGVAAHWKYKEGGGSAKSGYEERIAWLRKILAWQDDVAESGNLVEELRNQVFEDRVYVFTPKGDVVDLPTGSTPLDFAYYIHSLVGHRCIGAKIGGKIVPFTYMLQTGDQVEVITAKEPNPSRDWLNPNLGYLKSSRARAKVQHWFKQQDRDKNIAAGREMLDTELSRVGLKLADLSEAVDRFNVTNVDDLLAAVGGGDVKLNQVVNHLQSKLQKPSDEEADELVLKKTANVTRKPPKDVLLVEGVGNLMTHMARCCQPVPGDPIMGYITQGRGISIHRQDCDQLADLLEAQPERGMETAWGENYAAGYSLTIRLLATDRSGLLRDITTILANDKINVLGVKSRSDVNQQTAIIDMELEIYNKDSLSRVLTRLGQLPDVMEAKRL
ncbi:GTP diphosphokinase [Corallincola spongiicola]|uniref:GTP pyrophosphokinase n=1 Tax=Corallincola spongiicola TaxID=2520508 RepID=A0ABY1WRK5_9GAMM|nr:GTP diphosphokinase [Corallincola spongiicola]TAA47356.1 GTP diphosphokinase [Corallincola spongiicola]